METIELDFPMPKRKKVTEKLTEKKIAVSDKSIDVLNSKLEERTDPNEDVFGK